MREADFQREGETRVAMNNSDGRYPRFWEAHLIILKATQFDSKSKVIRDDELQILDLGNAYARIVNFNDDTLGDRELKPRISEAGACHIRASMSPSRVRSGPWCVHDHSPVAWLLTNERDFPVPK